MAKDNQADPNAYDGIFAITGFLILGATVLLAVGGIYYTFINPSF